MKLREMYRWELITMTAILLTLFSAWGWTETMRQQALFVQGQGGYNNYRIPALLTTQKGTLLAFCEGREGGDSSDIDLLLRRSEDGGKTWSRKQVVWNQRRNVCGNPCPIQDQDSGVIWLLLTWNDSTDSGRKLHNGTSKDTRRVYVCSSEDDGRTWSKPIEITATTKKKNWWWYATGPGVGIQLRQGPHKGRLVIPCDHTNKNGHGSHIIYSDDHGNSWKLGGSVSGGCNECQVVELADDKLLLNMRMQENGQGKRGIATSEDGGQTWSELKLDPVLIEPICQASLLRYTLASTNGKNRLLFSNPASAPSPGQSRGDRVKMTVRLSYDEGKTWPISKLLHNGPSAYSCLAVMPDGDIGCLYEGGEIRYGEIVFARFSLEWLTDGKDCR
ncbi:MAG: sialidase family protein [Planctomycetota bacterium]